MIVLDCKQGSRAWHAARLGIPTASAYARILPLGKGAESYMNELLAEWLIGCPVDVQASPWMERGKQLERWAVSYYELQRDCETRTVGFCLSDDRKTGCSPDRFVMDDGGLEIKCPTAANHVAYLRGGLDVRRYDPQVQGCLWITGRKWWDVMSYNPEIQPIIVRVERDEEMIEKIERCVRTFCVDLDAAREALLGRGLTPAREIKLPAGLAMDDEPF